MFLNRLQIVLLSILIPLGLLYLFSESQGVPLKNLFSPTVPIMKIGDVPIRVEIASSQQERTTGLSGRESLDEVSGLLFVFPTADYHSIWMKDMRFPIDIIWISEDLVVVGVDKGVSPESYPNLFRPPLPAKYVLETNIHYADTFGIRAGQKVELPLGDFAN